MGGGGSGEIKVVSAHSDADPVHFGLDWSYGGNHSSVCDFATMGDGGFFYKEDGVGAGGYAGANALGEAS